MLALLLRTLSSNLDLREYGLHLCRTILQVEQLKLLARGVSAPKHKDFVISPCLRLLTELVSFDGGAVAKQVYAKRDFTFDGKILARNLGIRRTEEDTAKDKRRPAVRTNAVKYLLANFRNQEEGAKIDILKQGHVVRALFDYIRDDPPEVATEILEVVKSHVIADKEVHRYSKSHMLTDRVLSNIASLYRAEQPLEEDSNEKAIDVVAHRFLLDVCRSADAGVLIPSSGWYPPGTDKEPEREDDDANIDLGLDSLEWYERYRGRVIIRNPALATFLQGLRPYSNKLEQELVLAILESCPELFADYFFKKTTFTFDPKLTATWIGYASFLFSAIQLPVPRFFGRKEGYASVPPPVSVVAESLLPQPLTQKVLTKCLNQNSDLITFFAIRLLIIAFQKLEQVLINFKKASSHFSHDLWDQAAERLVSEFQERCPKMKDVILAFRKISETSLMQREAVTRLLSMYYTVTPQAALHEKFDVSMALINSLNQIEKHTTAGEDREIKLVELSHLLSIARSAPDMRWWQKPESLQFSPFTSVLRVLASSPDGATSKSITKLLISVIRDHGILRLESIPSSFDALVASIRSNDDDVPANAVFGFLDECFGRFVRKPIKYQDDLDGLMAAAKVDKASGASVSLLLATVVEQWPFVLKMEKNAANEVAQWIAKFLALLQQVGESDSVLQSILNTMLAASEGAACRKPLTKALKGGEPLEIKALVGDSTSSGVDGGNSAGQDGSEDIEISLELPPKEADNHPELNRWMQKDVDDAVEDGHMGELVLCLCSEHLSIRRQALPNLQKLMAKVQVYYTSKTVLLTQANNQLTRRRTTRNAN